MGPRLLLRWTPSLPAARQGRRDIRLPGIRVRQRRGPFLHILRVWRIVGRGLTLRRRGHRQGWLLEFVIEFRRSQGLGLRGTISHPQSGAASKSVPGKPHPLRVSTFLPLSSPPTASLAAIVELILYDPELYEEASYPCKL